MVFILEDSDKSESRIVIPIKMFFKKYYLHRRENKYKIMGYLLLLFHNLAVNSHTILYLFAGYFMLVLCFASRVP